jgi:16S rRNA (adenine1518-N6/adenine1519-N6)-dimethyltransferase
MIADRDRASPDGLPPLRDVINEYGLRARKSLGQNFILDFNLTRRIARAAGPLQGKTVIEIGPGPGGLTRAFFLEGARRVVAIERDRHYRPALEAIARRYPERFTLQIGDALAANWAQLQGNCAGKPVIAANLPYNVATRLLVGWLESEPWPPWYAKLVLMFQKEVAQRIMAMPETKPYGRLAVISQWRTNPRQLFILPPDAFTPPPKVASALVEFVPRERPTPACPVKVLAEITAAAFGQRRKMLRQSLKSLVSDPEALLTVAAISPTLRGEALTVRQFAELAYLLARLPANTVEAKQ